MQRSTALFITTRGRKSDEVPQPAHPPQLAVCTAACELPTHTNIGPYNSTSAKPDYCKQRVLMSPYMYDTSTDQAQGAEEWAHRAWGRRTSTLRHLPTCACPSDALNQTSRNSEGDAAHVDTLHTYKATSKNSPQGPVAWGLANTVKKASVHETHSGGLYALLKLQHRTMNETRRALPTPFHLPG